MTRPTWRSDVPGIEWPAVATDLAASLGALVRQLEDTQWMSATEIEAHQIHQLSALARHAALHAPHFRRRLAQASLRPDDLMSREGLAALPVLRRRELQTAGADLLSTELPPSHLPVSDNWTSGATGEPVMVRRTGIGHLFWLAMTMRGHLWHGDDFSRRFAAIRPHFRDYAEQPDWGPPCALLYRTGAALALPIVATARQHVEWLARFQPYMLLTFPSIVDAICQYCRRHDFVLPGLETIWTVSETLSPRVREGAQETLGAKIADIYSSNEVGTIAVQCPDGDGYHVMAECVIVEILDAEGRRCEAGEIGRVVVTDLHNFAQPLVRYDIGDYAEAGAPCRCGRGLPTLKRIIGRERNLALMPDGTRRYPLTGFHRFRDIAPISQFQLVQRAPGAVEVRLVAEAPVTGAQESELAAIIRRALGAPFALSFTYFPDQIPRGAGGKFEEFVCEIPR
ncbi:MAG TPA: AMP-binding protein [Stellaceae bacterium]|nr:AMP-binding protein [Stellaceae bacterium]